MIQFILNGRLHHSIELTKSNKITVYDMKPGSYQKSTISVSTQLADNNFKKINLISHVTQRVHVYDIRVLHTVNLSLLVSLHTVNLS